MKKLLPGILLCFFTACNSLFYQGDHKPYRQPEAVNIRCEREKILSIDSTSLQTMVCPPVQKSTAVVVQFHGNAQNMYSHYRFLSWLVAEGYTLATFDYRGYGDSDGESSRKGIYEDARSYIKYVRNKFAADERIFYGQSLGGAVLMRALVDEGLRKDEIYIFEGTFASYREVARGVLARRWFLWPFQYLAYVLVNDSYSAKDELAAFAHYAVLVIHGDSDPVVAYEEGQRLAQEMHAPLWTVVGGKHIDAWFVEHGRLRPELLERLKAIRATRRGQ